MTNKLSLHDFFGMLIPGCFWVLIYVHTGKNLNILIENQFFKTLVYLTIGYSVGLVWHMIIDYLSKLFRPISLYIHYVFGPLTDEQYREIPGVDLKDRYYYAYEYVQQYSKNYGIKFVEGQVLLIRNLSLPFAILLTNYIDFNHPAGIIILVCSASVLLMLLRQMTIYRLVYEEYFYLKKVHDTTNQF